MSVFKTQYLLFTVLVSVNFLLQLERANGSSLVGHFKRKADLNSIPGHLKDTSPKEQDTQRQGGLWMSITRQPGPAGSPDRDAFELTVSDKDKESSGLLLDLGDLEESDWLRHSKRNREKRRTFGKITWHREKPRGYPGFAIGRLGNGCTAFFIGPFQALTAAHCVYKWRTRQWIEWALDIASLSDCTKPYLASGYKKEWVSVHVPQRYIEAGLWTEDVALIVTRQSVWPGVKPFLQLAEYPTDSQSMTNITIYGYPLHVLNAVSHRYLSRPLHCLVSSSCSDAESSPYIRSMLSYKCDTVQGMSGSPIMAQDLSGDTNEYFVYGVHTLGHAFRNFGVQFTLANIDQIKDLLCNVTALRYPSFCHTNGTDSSSDMLDGSGDTEYMNSTNVTEVTIATTAPTTSPFTSVTRSKK